MPQNRITYNRDAKSSGAQTQTMFEIDIVNKEIFPRQSRNSDCTAADKASGRNNSIDKGQTLRWSETSPAVLPKQAGILALGAPVYAPWREYSQWSIETAEFAACG